MKEVHVKARNDGNHTESFGVYVDIIPPGGITNPYGCTPAGRIIDTVVTLAPTQQQIIAVFPTFNCTDVAGAMGLTWTVIAVIDVHADDGGPCGPGQLLSMTCFNALADDDDDDGDNRVSASIAKVS